MRADSHGVVSFALVVVLMQLGLQQNGSEEAAGLGVQRGVHDLAQREVWRA